MIQRIQHVYLFFAALFVAILYPITLCTYTCVANISYFNLKISGLFDNQNQNIYEPKYMSLLLSIGLVYILIVVATIFIFKNRRLQMKLTFISLFLLVIFGILLGYIISETNYFLPADCEYATSIGLGLILPVLSFVFTILAYAGIKKDENLIKSVDRLR